MSKKSLLGAAERTAVVLQLLAKEEPAAQLARRAGVSEVTLFRWREQFIEAGSAWVAGKGNPSPHDSLGPKQEGLQCGRNSVLNAISDTGRPSGERA